MVLFFFCWNLWLERKNEIFNEFNWRVEYVGLFQLCKLRIRTQSNQKQSSRLLNKRWAFLLCTIIVRQHHVCVCIHLGQGLKNYSKLKIVTFVIWLAAFFFVAFQRFTFFKFEWSKLKVFHVQFPFNFFFFLHFAVETFSFTTCCFIMLWRARARVCI